MKCIFCALAVAAVAALPNASQAINLFTDNFDADHTASWSPTDNGFGTNAANLFFDYSSVGIPSAPHSTGGSTRGLKLSANVGVAPSSGQPAITVSPNGQSFTGDYTLEFDWWHNYIGPLNTATQTGSSMLSEYGIMTNGSAFNYPGFADGVYFAATGDGGTAQDYRIYSSENPTGYAKPDPAGHAIYAATSQNSTAALYTTLFPAGATAPTTQQTNYPATQIGATVAGNAGFRWHDVKIIKSGTLVTWSINGTVIGSLETANLSIPASGTNILFGQSDINTTTSTDVNYPLVQFTLIDNVVVSTPPAADFNGNTIVDAADYTIWRDNFGNASATKATGDANGDQKTDLTDFNIWKSSFSSPGSGGGGLSPTGVPEPSTLLLALSAATAIALFRRH